MSEYLLILVSTILVNNIVLVKFLGLCPFMGVSNKLESALVIGFATTFVMTLASVASFITTRYILVPLDALYLRTIVFIVVIAAVVQLTELMMRRTAPLLHRMLGLYLPLITTNCAVLGVALLNSRAQRDFFHSALEGFGAAVGFSLVLVLFAGLRLRIEQSDTPRPFQGAPIALISAGLMALAFMGFSGLVKG